MSNKAEMAGVFETPEIVSRIEVGEITKMIDIAEIAYTAYIIELAKITEITVMTYMAQIVDMPEMAEWLKLLNCNILIGELQLKPNASNYPNV